MVVVLPNFLVIGAARSGTTALYHALSEHPDVFMPTVKEPHFFTTQWSRGRAWYEDLFANHVAQRAIGEASVSYTYPMYEDTEERILATLGRVRLVYVVREPISRAHSHFLYYQNYKQSEKGSFAEAIRDNPIYLGASDYASWVRRYRAAFGRDALHVVVYDDLERDPIATVQGVYAFLGVDASVAPVSAGERTNASFVNKRPLVLKAYRRLSKTALRRAVESRLPHRWRSRIRNVVRSVVADKRAQPTVDSEVHRELARHFAPQIADLETLIDRDLSSWRTTSP